MTLYDVFSSTSQFSNIQGDLSNTLFYVLGARHIRITEAAPQFPFSFTRRRLRNMYSTTDDPSRYPLESRAFIPAEQLNDSVMSRIVPRCSCQGELAITGEIRSPDGWRTGFNLRCKQCGKKWTYSGGIYRQDSEEKAG